MVATLFSIDYTVFKLAFSVPGEETNPIAWLFRYRKPGMIIYIILVLLLISMLILLYVNPLNIPFEAPLSPAGLLTISTTILLFSNFFIVKTPENPRNFDSHPLILYTAILFVSLAIITGGAISIRNFKRSRVKAVGVDVACLPV
ncbi:MAG: hypothetical protein ACYCQJ_15570 [Nitrososphaerales archaeon]